MISLHPPHTKKRRTRTKLPGRRETRLQFVHKTVTLFIDMMLSTLQDGQEQLVRRIAARTVCYGATSQAISSLVTSAPHLW
jgi:hypothetical protein